MRKLIIVAVVLFYGTIFKDLNQNLNAQISGPGKDNFYGMFIGNDTDIPKSIPVLNDLGVKWVRLWADINWADTSAEHGAFTSVRNLKAAGFNTILLLNHINVPDSLDVKKYVSWALKRPGMKEAVDVWEILNELNVSNNFVNTADGKYWKGTPEEYVNKVLRPAFNVLHPAGELVLGASFTAWQWNGSTWGTGTWQVDKVVKAGYLNYCDYAGIHPYVDVFGDMIKIVNESINYYGNKPVIISEWNFKQRSSYDQWANDLTNARKELYGKVFTTCYYRLISSASEGGWPGIVKSGNYPAQYPFYDAFKSWPKTENVLLNNAPDSVSFLNMNINGNVFNESDNIPLEVFASDTDGTIDSVVFYTKGKIRIGVDNAPADGWKFNWANPTPGAHNILAIAYDNDGAHKGCYGLKFSVNPSVSGKIISINFQGLGPLLAAEDSAGVVPCANWNNAQNNTTNGDLTDEFGVNTGATVSNNIPSNYVSSDANLTAGDYKMMAGYIAPYDNSSKSISITNLPPSFANAYYDVYLYWGNKDRDNDIVKYKIGNQTYYLRDTTPTWSGIHVISEAVDYSLVQPGASYVKFRNLTGSSFSLILQAFGTYRAGISGMQIVLNGHSAPVAQAGEDASLIDSDKDNKESYTLNGESSYDPDGSIVQYSWKDGSKIVGTGSVLQTDLTVGLHKIILEVTDNDGLKDVDTVLINISMSNNISDPTSEYFSDIILYPNPAKDFLTIYIDREIGGVLDASIYDIAGKMLLNNKIDSDRRNSVITLESLPDGIYWIRIMSKDKIYVRKFLKQ